MAKKQSKEEVADTNMVELQAEEALQPQKINFVVWWAMNEKKIPMHHYKEIIKADFEGQGLSNEEPMEAFDAALKKYGLNIKN